MDRYSVENILHKTNDINRNIVQKSTALSMSDSRKDATFVNTEVLILYRLS